MSAQARDPSQRPAGAPGQATLLNRFGFEEHLLREWERARHAQAPLSLLLIALDPAPAGAGNPQTPTDETRLKQVAAALAQAVLRPTDVLARYGDGEFAVLLPAVHEEGARVVADRVRALVHGPTPSRSGGVTVSIGVAALEPADGGRPQQLVDLCAQALEQARRQGRDGIGSRN